MLWSELSCMWIECSAVHRNCTALWCFMWFDMQWIFMTWEKANTHRESQSERSSGGKEAMKCTTIGRKLIMCTLLTKSLKRIFIVRASALWNYRPQIQRTVVRSFFFFIHATWCMFKLGNCNDCLFKRIASMYQKDFAISNGTEIHILYSFALSKVWLTSTKTETFVSMPFL